MDKKGVHLLTKYALLNNKS